jgi:hypothetical protein
MKEYDIVLVHLLVRKHPYYANIVKALSSQYRIGLLLSDEKDFYASRKAHRKVKNTEKIFRSLCVQLGVEKIYVNEKIRGKVVIMPTGLLSQLFASEDYIFKFKKNISWGKLIGLFSFIGDIYGLDSIKDLGASRFFVPAKNIFETKMEYEGKLEKIDGLDIIEMGFPHKKHPIFDNIDSKIDYLVAYPAHTHFKRGKEKEKYTFVINLYKLLKKIDASNNIYLKPHNNNDDSQFFPSLNYGSIWFLRVTSFIANILLTLSPFFRSKLYKIEIRLKNSIIKRAYPSLKELTPYHNLGIEFFLPYVRKGLITGLSSTHIHAMLNELSVYNCDPQQNDEATAPFNEMYLVPSCSDKLVFDKSNFDRISKECRSADVIQLIKEELNGL